MINSHQILHKWSIFIGGKQPQADARHAVERMTTITQCTEETRLEITAMVEAGR
jgi:hypothetical protein